MGYLNNKTATAESYDSEGFLHTGDLGSFDDKGLLIIHDRLKEVIKVRACICMIDDSVLTRLSR